MSQGILPFQDEVKPVASGMIALAGLPSYLDLAAVCDLTESIRQHLTVCSQKKPGWTDDQIVMTLILLNLAGGESVEDLRILEGDNGFAQVRRRVETHGLPRKERRTFGIWKLFMTKRKKKNDFQEKLLYQLKVGVIW